MVVILNISLFISLILFLKVMIISIYFLFILFLLYNFYIFEILKCEFFQKVA